MSIPQSIPPLRPPGEVDLAIGSHEWGMGQWGPCMASSPQRAPNVAQASPSPSPVPVVGDLSDPTRPSGFVLQWQITGGTIVMTVSVKATGVQGPLTCAILWHSLAWPWMMVGLMGGQ